MHLALRASTPLLALFLGAWLAQVTSTSAWSAKLPVSFPFVRSATGPGNAAGGANAPPSSAFSTDSLHGAVHSDPSTLNRQHEALNTIALSVALGQRFGHGQIMTGDTPHRLILFTFDDGPDRQHTPALLDALDERGIKAVFFLSAWRIAGHTAAQRVQAEIAIDAMRRGHIIGSHGLDHLQLPMLDSERAREQILGAQAVFERIFGQRPWLFRPPGGARSERIDAMLAELGYTTVMWNLGTGDVQVRSAEEVFETWKRVLDRAEREGNQNGGIILLHDTHAWSVEGFKLIYDELLRRNCQYLERGEELYDVLDDPSFFFHPRNAAHPSSRSPASFPDLEILEARQRRLRALHTKRCS